MEPTNISNDASVEGESLAKSLEGQKQGHMRYIEDSQTFRIWEISDINAKLKEEVDHLKKEMIRMKLEAEASEENNKAEIEDLEFDLKNLRGKYKKLLEKSNTQPDGQNDLKDEIEKWKNMYQILHEKDRETMIQHSRETEELRKKLEKANEQSPHQLDDVSDGLSVR